MRFFIVDSGFSLVLQLMVQVLCHILDCACIVVSTRWNIVKEELANLILAVQRFGNAAMNSSVSIVCIILKINGINLVGQ